MIPFARLYAAVGAASLFAACVPETGGEREPFAVRFTLASVPGNLTLDSMEAEIELGDEGRPQDFVVDLKTGTSKARVMAYPGQAYKLAFRLYASGFEIGAGEAAGTLSRDMDIEIHPAWDPSRIESARAARLNGKLLPAYLESSFDKALAGRDLGIRLDSAADHVYTWYIRSGSRVVASGEGTRVAYAPPDSLGGTILNLKLVVKKGARVIEERDWDVKVLAGLPRGLRIGVITKSDTSTSSGGYARYRYSAAAWPDSIVYYDTTVYVPGRASVGSLAYTYIQASRPSGSPSRVVRAAVNEIESDSSFSYDDKGRLVAVIVTGPGGATVDSLAYPAENAVTIATRAHGRLTRLVKHVRESAEAEVDSIWSPVDTGLALSGRITYALAGGQVVNLRVYRKFGAELAAYRSEWTLYNSLGMPAFRNHYEEGPTLLPDKTETYAYRPDGRLGRILRRDEVTGEIEHAEWFVYQDDGEETLPRSPAAAKALSARFPAAGSGIPFSDAGGLLNRLAGIGLHFPSSRNTR